MKWRRKHIVDIKEAHRRNQQGESVGKLASSLGVPTTTLNRYLHQAGYPILCNREETCKKSWYTRERNREVYICSEAWKRALVRRYGYRCMICGYNKIVEAHHIVPATEGGQMTIKNGALVCPNHHAESHAGLVDLKVALSKRGELLENPEKDNQQPSYVSSNLVARDIEGSETNSRAKAVMETRAPRLDKRLAQEEWRRHSFLRQA